MVVRCEHVLSKNFLEVAGYALPPRLQSSADEQPPLPVSYRVPMSVVIAAFLYSAKSANFRDIVSSVAPLD